MASQGQLTPVCTMILYAQLVMTVMLQTQVNLLSQPSSVVHWVLVPKKVKKKGDTLGGVANSLLPSHSQHYSVWEYDLVITSKHAHRTAMILSRNFWMHWKWPLQNLHCYCRRGIFYHSTCSFPETIPYQVVVHNDKHHSPAPPIAHSTPHLHTEVS